MGRAYVIKDQKHHKEHKKEESVDDERRHKSGVSGTLCFFDAVLRVGVLINRAEVARRRRDGHGCVDTNTRFC